MRIAVNTRLLLEGKLEGMGWFTFEVLQELVRQRPDDEFIFFFDRAYAPAFVFADNITPVVLQPPARHPILFYLWFEWAVPAALRRYEADVFISPDNFASLRTTVPTILVVHDLAYLHFPEHLRKRDLWHYRYFMPRFVARADRLLTVSNYTKADIAQQYGVAVDEIGVLCNSCRPEFQPLSLEKQAIIRREYSNDCPYFLYIGAVHPRKNVHRLIAAFDRFKKETGASHQLLIAGRFAWQTGEVRTAFEAATHQEEVHFLGYVPNEILPQLMGAASALTYISLFEGFGVPLLEAMHCEVPIITSNVSSLPEVVGDAALLVDPHSVEDIADKMKMLVETPVLQTQLVRAGRIQRTQFSWAAAATVLSEKIEELRKTEKSQNK